MKESQMQNDISEEFVKMTPAPRKQRLLKIAFVGMVTFLVVVLATLLWPRYVYSPHKSATFTAAIAKPLVQVEVGQDGFSPKSVQINSGDSVTWINNGTASHEVAADPFPSKATLPGLDSGELSSGQSYQFNFAKPGTYTYHDQLNPLLSGTVVVQ